MKRVETLLVALAVCLVAAGSSAELRAAPAGDETARPTRIQRLVAEGEFDAEFPGVRMYREGERIVRIYGRAFSSGQTIAESADSFRRDHAGMLGAAAADLQPVAGRSPLPHVQPVMYQPETDSYKFHLVTYGQQSAGIPVFRSDLRLLVRNMDDNPVVWAASSLRELGAFEIEASLRDQIDNVEFIDARYADARALALRTSPDLANFSQPAVVIWAGAQGESVEPRTALTFTANNFGPQSKSDEDWLFVADLQTGEILYRESQIYTGVVQGNVSGMASEGPGSDACEAEVLQPIRYTTVTSASDTAFTDLGGDFVIANGGATVDASVDGRWFNVSNVQGPETVVSGPSSFDIVLNEDNLEEHVRAQVNAYVETNRVRDYVERFNPSYPTLTDTDILVRVNRNDSLCPGNAWYSPSDNGSASGYSLNFCQSSTNRPNTAYSSIVHHEFGHHVVRAGGSGQGAYGEGMGDVMAVLIADDPRLAPGFFNNCNGQLRNAANTLQYPCSGGGHFCGQLISGAVWDTRHKLAFTRPSDYLDILSNLAINAVLLHSGSGIAPDITIDYLTLDDDDGNLLNGSPHFAEIDAGFGAHNMPGPALLAGLDVTPKVDLVAAADSGGPFAPDSRVYTLQNAESSAKSYRVSASEPWVSLTDASGVVGAFQSQDVTVSVNSGALALPTGLHRATVEFVNETDGIGNRTQQVVLEIDRANYDSSGFSPIPKLFTVTDSIDVADAFCVGDVNVNVDLIYAATQNLTVDLESPDGTVVRLHDRTGGSDIVATYDDEGSKTPDGPGKLADFTRKDVNGTWTLTIVNNSTTVGGVLNSWSLGFVQLGATCPPRSKDLDISVPGTSLSTIALDSDSGSGNPLSYIVASLPAAGELFDPSGGKIDAVPYVLSAGGNLVEYVPANGYLGPDAFQYKANDGLLDSNLAEVEIQVGLRRSFASFSLDADPGWSTTGAWDFGQPAGNGSRSGDPTSGFTGANVLGYNLSGDYANGLGEESLTSTPIDCSDFIDVEVAFQRWLGVESTTFDRAAFQVSTDGTNFVTVWENSINSIDESDWSRQSYDISDLADGQPAVYLRWVMGGTDATQTFPGWNIDDVELSGVEPPGEVSLTVGPTELSWSNAPGAVSYDIVRGDLHALRSSGGDFTQATDACVGDGVEASPLPYADLPAPGAGTWLLVRGVSTSGTLTYETFAGSQVGLRDDEVDAAPLACP